MSLIYIYKNVDWRKTAKKMSKDGKKISWLFLEMKSNSKEVWKEMKKWKMGVLSYDEHIWIFRTLFAHEFF